MRILIPVTAALLLCACATRAAAPETVVWKFDDVSRIGGIATEVVGGPKTADGAIAFDGEADGVFVPVNPIAGWATFTIEVKFRQDGHGGAEEQRFVHVEDSARRRVLIETRVTPDRRWALDTFLFQDAGHKLTLLDRQLLHPAGEWHWAALAYDGKTMRQYVNGVLELEGDVAFVPMLEGRTSFGVRQNLVSWFNGSIAEARFTPRALPAAQLRK
jgi:hypothetical protein